MTSVRADRERSRISWPGGVVQGWILGYASGREPVGTVQAEGATRSQDPSPIERVTIPSPTDQLEVSR